MKLVMFCPCIRKYLSHLLALVFINSYCYLGDVALPNPRCVQACECWVSEMLFVLSKLGSPAGIPTGPLQCTHFFVKWHLPCWYKAKKHTIVTLAGAFSQVLSEKPRWVEVFILKIWVTITCFSVSPGWRYQGKVRKYICSFFMGSTTLRLERGANLCLFLGFKKVLLLRFPYSVVVSSSF